MRHSSLRSALSAVLALALMLTILPGRAVAIGYSVNVNGKVVAATEPELKNGQLAVAVRPFVEAMGGQVIWKAAERQILIRHQGSEMAMWQGSLVAYQNGTKLTVPFAPFMRDGRTMVPAWWLATRLGAKVRFDGTTLFVETATAQAAAPGNHYLMKPSYVFPYPDGARYERYYDSMGAPRFYGGRSFYHEGTDILAAKGTPVVAVAAGKVVRFGWNTLGGYRVTIELDDHPGWRFYYAHMDRYAPNIGLGSKIKAGQLLGYTGNTGEGPERTEGKFVPHLHFGMYAPDGSAVNPFPFLKYWENNKFKL